jgi:hypothetical protein
MSYDLMVFEPEAAPKDHQRFLDWYFEQTKWNEGHSYGDPAITSNRLRDWFVDISNMFPPLNGVFSKEELPDDEASATDYSIGKQIIYAAFAWSKSDSAYQTVFDLAAKHNLGFFNVSSDLEEVWLPRSGQLMLTHQKMPLTAFDKVRRFFDKS